VKREMREKKQKKKLSMRGKRRGKGQGNIAQERKKHKREENR
jgi:hypothetical protein